MAPDSSVIVRLRLIGATAFANGARRDAVALGEMGRAGEVAGAKMKAMSGAMGVAGGAIAGVGRALKRLAFPVALIGAASGKMAMDFQQSMELIHTQAGASQHEVEQLSGAVLNLAKIEPQSPKDLADALYRLEGAGLRGSKAMRGLKAAADLAAVGNANVEDTAKTLSQVWFSGIKGAGSLRKVVAEMNATVGAGDLRLQALVDALGTGIMPVAKNAGLRMRDITGVLAVFGDETNNVSGWTAQLATALHYLYAPTTKAEGALEGIGLSGSKLGRDFRKKQGLLTAMKDLRAHLDKLPGGFRGLKASQTLAQILPGGRGRVLNVLLGQLDRYQQKLHQVGATTKNFGDAVRKTHETAAFKIKAAWSTIQVAMIRLGGHILPAAAGAFVGVAKGIDFLSGKLEGLAHSKAGGVLSRIAAGVGVAVSTAAGGGPKGPRPTAAPHQALRAAEPGASKGLSSWQKAGLKIRGVIGDIAKSVGPVAQQLIGAFKPALPFFENILLPLLKGIASGVIGGVVVAFKLLVPIIRIVATALGFIGKLAAPIKPLFYGIGVVIGFIAGGPILDFLSGLGKVGIVFKLMAIPLRIAGGALRFVGRVIGFVARGFMRGFTFIQRFLGTLTGAARDFTTFHRMALNALGAVIHFAETMPRRVAGAAGKLVSGIVGRLGGAAKAVTGVAGRIGRAIVNGVVGAIRAAPGAIGGAILSIVPKGVKNAVRKVVPGIATGGVVKRGGVAVVGERGPELMNVPTGATVYSNRVSRRAGAQMAPRRGESFTANLFLDGKQIHSAVFRADRAMAEMS